MSAAGAVSFYIGKALLRESVKKKNAIYKILINFPTDT